MFFAACAAPCIAVCATPGSSVPPDEETPPRRPTTKTSGMPGNREIGLHETRPARSSGTPSVATSGEAATPAAHTIVPASSRSVPSITPCASMCVTATPSRISMPSRRQRFDARPVADSREMSPAGRLASTSTMRARDVSIDRNSSRSVWRAISASVPASSTPVGPPPTSTNVSSSPLPRGIGLRARLARTRAGGAGESSIASSSVFSPGANGSHSAWPKYAWRRAAGDDQIVVRRATPPSASSTRRAATSIARRLAKQHAHVPGARAGSIGSARRCRRARASRSRPDIAAVERRDGCGDRAA